VRELARSCVSDIGDFFDEIGNLKKRAGAPARGARASLISSPSRRAIPRFNRAERRFSQDGHLFFVVCVRLSDTRRHDHKTGEAESRGLSRALLKFSGGSGDILRDVLL
jgi:hypothetical protein